MPPPVRLSQGAAFAGLVFTFAVAMLGTTMPTPMYPLYEAKLGFSVVMLTVILDRKSVV